MLDGDGRLVGKITQGVTTEILGEGESDAPSSRFDGPHGFDDWLKAMKRHGGSVNFGSFLGSQTVRAYVKGMKPGPATVDELETMKRVVRSAMKDGAFGLASALIYPPDTFVSTEDLVALSKEMAPFGGVYITHMRSEADQLLEALDEAIRIGREGGVPVEIYHLKAAGRRNWEKARLAVEKITQARASGLDVGANMYPYTAAGTGLTACLPPSASADGKLYENLANPQNPRRDRGRGDEADDPVGEPRRARLARGRPGPRPDQARDPEVRRQAPLRDRQGRGEALGRGRDRPDPPGA